MLAKLDAYDYELYPGKIRVRINGPNDADICDIMSEISRARGRIYIEGRRYKYLNNYNIEAYHMDLDVKEIS